MATHANHIVARRSLPKSTRGARLIAVALAAIVLALIGWRSALALDSALLGFVIADLIGLIGVAFAGAVRSGQKSRYAR